MTHALDLGVDVATLLPTGAWALGTTGKSELGVSTWLAASNVPPGTWEPLDCDLVEVSWRQGGGSGPPERVVPRPEPGTAEVTFLDPTLRRVPAPGQAGGIRQGLPLRVVDRGTGRVLWYGWVERVEWDMAPGNPLHTARLVGTDVLTRLARSAEVQADRPPEAASVRALWLMATYAPPDVPSRIDPAATTMVAATTTDSLWAALVDTADADLGWLWGRRDGSLDLIASKSLVSAGHKWTVPHDCLPISVPVAVWDAMGWGTRWTVVRRPLDPDDQPPPQTSINAQSETRYGTWRASTLTDYPVAYDPDARRAADLAAAWHGWPLAGVSEVAVDAAAGSTGPDAAFLLGLCTDLELGDRLDVTVVVPYGPPNVPELVVVGWEWTWTAAGALRGTLASTPSPGAAIATGYWVMDLSVLQVDTILAPGGLPS